MWKEEKEECEKRCERNKIVEEERKMNVEEERKKN